MQGAPTSKPDRTKVFWRGALAEVIQNLPNDVGVIHIDDDPQPSTTVRAECNVELKDRLSGRLHCAEHR